MGDGFSQWEVASVNIILATYVTSDYHCPGHYFLWAMDVSDGCRDLGRDFFALLTNRRHYYPLVLLFEGQRRTQI